MFPVFRQIISTNLSRSVRNVHATGDILPHRLRSAPHLPTSPGSDKSAVSPGDADARTRRTADRRMGQVSRLAPRFFTSDTKTNLHTTTKRLPGSEAVRSRFRISQTFIRRTLAVAWRMSAWTWKCARGLTSHLGTDGMKELSWVEVLGCQEKIRGGGDRTPC